MLDHIKEKHGATDFEDTLMDSLDSLHLGKIAEKISISHEHFEVWSKFGITLPSIQDINGSKQKTETFFASPSASGMGAAALTDVDVDFTDLGWLNRHGLWRPL